MHSVTGTERGLLHHTCLGATKYQSVSLVINSGLREEVTRGGGGLKTEEDLPTIFITPLAPTTAAAAHGPKGTQGTPQKIM